MKLLLAFLLMAGMAKPVHAQTAETQALSIYGNACEKVIEGESKASTRVRAADKAVFLGVKKLPELARVKSILNEHDVNVLVYRLVDEYIEDLSSSTVSSDAGKVCVEINGYLPPEAIEKVQTEFIKAEKPLKEAAPEVVAEVASEVKREVDIKPVNPESLALVYIGPLEYYNGAKSNKYSKMLQEQFAGNQYFYLTEDAEIADYVITPKVLKAKVDNLDAAHKRLQMVVSLEITGLKNETVNEYQNRFVLFGAEENEQQTAARLLNKLIETAGANVLRKIEHNEQLHQEKQALGRAISEAD
ncbi:MAG: hypothetical protein SO141_00275 [Alphaproteobacteria bacterium]|nr:hypothetical protein [Alphaproteobacteria bacterium]